MTDADINGWINRGIRGFYCLENNLYGLEKPGDGGDPANYNYGLEWTADPAHTLSGPTYIQQKRLRDGPLRKRVQAGDVKVYLGFFTQNNNCNTFTGPLDKCDTRYGPYGYLQTPFVEWFDDSRWINLVLPKIKDIAGASKLLGFSGIAIDQEVYGGPATWDWNYPGNTRTEAEVRSKAKERGKQFMQTLLAAHPGIELVGYNFQFTETWEELVSLNYSGPSFQNSVMINFWDGLSSIEGYSALRALDWSFYKWSFPDPKDRTGPQNWTGAMRYSQRSMQSVASRQFSNWNYAASRFYHTPFVWISSNDPVNGYPIFPPTYVDTQLQAAKVWGMDGEIGLYGNSYPGFDYGPYVPNSTTYQ